MRCATRFLALSLILSCNGPATPSASPEAAKPATPVTPAASGGQTVTFPSTSGNASGYFALPTGAGKHPAIIVIQEWWGVNDWIRQQTDRFASQGYVALAVDLYRGKVAKDQDVAHELMRGMPEDRAMGDLKSAFNYLASRPDVDPARIGSVGWCMGGGYSLALAAAEPRLAADVLNYGHLITDSASMQRIAAPVLGNFGAADRGIPEADVHAFENAMRAAGKQIDVKVYPGAGHAFMNPNNTQGYVQDAAQDAQSRMDAFFEKNLKRGSQ
jgi:carboxymethylenebutenolidase